MEISIEAVNETAPDLLKALVSSYSALVSAKSTQSQAIINSSQAIFDNAKHTLILKLKKGGATEKGIVNFEPALSNYLERESKKLGFTKYL